MDTKAVVKHFGSVQKARDALMVSRQLWRHWCNGGIPIGRQWGIVVYTKGVLFADKQNGKRK